MPLIPRAIVMITVGLLSVGLVHAQQQGNGPARIDRTDHKFLDYAAEDNQAEIQLCLVAEKRADNPALKAFARLMVDDHAEIESRLAAIGNELQLSLPDGVGEDGQKTLAKLNPLQGHDFERQFMQAQVEDHSQDIDKFSKQLSSTQSERIRQFASETLPILQQHLALAQAVRKELDSETVGEAAK